MHERDEVNEMLNHIITLMDIWIQRGGNDIGYIYVEDLVKIKKAQKILQSIPKRRIKK